MSYVIGKTIMEKVLLSLQEYHYMSHVYICMSVK